MHVATERWASHNPGDAGDSSLIAGRRASAAGQRVIFELTPAFDDMDHELPAVLAAARADRFVRRG